MFRRWLMWPLVALAGLVVVLAAAVTGTAALVDAGYLHEPIRKLLVAKTRREIRVLGPVKIRLLSRHPSLTAEGVVIHNPPWMPAGILAEIGKVSLDLELPTLAEPLRLRRIELQSATFNLLRDASGKPTGAPRQAARPARDRHSSAASCCPAPWFICATHGVT